MATLEQKQKIEHLAFTVGFSYASHATVVKATGGFLAPTAHEVSEHWKRQMLRDKGYNVPSFARDAVIQKGWESGTIPLVAQPSAPVSPAATD
jgi:hypothetical protein